MRMLVKKEEKKSAYVTFSSYGCMVQMLKTWLLLLLKTFVKSSHVDK